MNNRTYRPFIPQEDHTNDVIQAEDINELQRTLEKAQEELFVQADASFLSKCLFTLEHHPDTNTMIVDLLEDSSKFDTSTIKNVSYDEDINSLTLDMPNESEGTIITRMMRNETGKPFRKIILLADEYKPDDSAIEYYISFDGVSYVQIQPNQAIPAITTDERAQLFIKIRFTRRSLESAPRLDAWALLYQDETYAFRFLDDGLDIGIESDWDGTIIK